MAALAILVGGFKLISGGPLVCTASFKSHPCARPTAREEEKEEEK